MKFFIPVKRDLKTLPPAISLIRGLASLEHDVHLLCYYCSPVMSRALEHPRITVTQISSEPYPRTLFARVIATLRAHYALWKTARAMAHYDILWIVCWDFVGLKFLARLKGQRGRSVYQFHEFEPERFSFCRAADVVVVPEENRAWITYILAGLKARPLVLPNIPFDHPRAATTPEPSIIDQLKLRGRKILLYQGYCSIQARCMFEVLEALALADAKFDLCIMPSPPITDEVRHALNARIEALGIEGRVHFLPTIEAPLHMNVVGKADVGIGLYRPTSINQVYCAPNRLYEFTGFGIPVILPSTPAIQQIAAKYPGILTCEPTSPRSIAAALNSMARDSDHEKAAKGARAFFDAEGSYTKSLESLIAQLV